MKSSYTADVNFSKYLNTAADVDPIKYLGHVSSVRGLEVVSEGPRSAIGEMCTIRLKDGKSLLAEVVGLDDTTVCLTPF